MPSGARGSKKVKKILDPTHNVDTNERGSEFVWIEAILG